MQNGLSKDEPVKTRIAKAKITIAVNNNQPQLIDVNNTTDYYTICRVSHDPNNQTIFLSTQPECPNAVNVYWPITSGMVDHEDIILVANADQTVYIFSKSLFDKAELQIQGIYRQHTFTDYFFTDHSMGSKLIYSII